MVSGASCDATVPSIAHAEATQMAPFGKKAWHACNVNPRSIGVEIAGYEKIGFSAN